MSPLSQLGRVNAASFTIKTATLVGLLFFAGGLAVAQGQAARADAPGALRSATTDSPPDPPETAFDFAVVPDTQNEVMVDGTPLLTGRYQWLSDNKTALNLKFIAHIGDLVNWGVADPIQFTRASIATTILDNSGVPFAYAIGNHDGAAVKVGGSAAPGNVRDNLRNTALFNQTFPLSRFSNVQGTFEPNKVDNMYQTFTAGGVQWLVLTHEMWPRESVIQWMKGVVASHSTYNVIVNTHAFADQAGNLPTDGNYGDQNAQIEWDEFVSQYPNIKVVVSGHYGANAPPVINAGYNYSERTGVNGNKVALIMTAYHSDFQDQVRLLKIDTAAGTISSSIYVSTSTSPAYPTGYITDGASNFVTTGMNWILPDGTSPPPVVTVPSAPSGAMATAGDGRATVGFVAPVSDGGSPVTGYTVISNPGGFSASGPSSPITVTGLTNGVGYSFTVRASNAVGTGTPSGASAVVVPQGAGLVELLPDPGFESGVGGWKAFNVGTLTSVVSPVHGGLKALRVAAVSSAANLVGLTQNAVISNSVSGRQYAAQCWVYATSAGLNAQIRFLQYTQDFSVNTKLNTALVNSLPVNTWTLLRVTGTATQTGYRIIPQIYSSNQTTNTGTITYDDCSVGVPVAVAPSAPSPPVAATAIGGDGQVVVGFTAPVSDGGSPVTGYTVTSSPGGFSASGSASPIVVNGLSNGTQYTFTVRASNAVGVSVPSAASGPVTPAAPVTVPSAPLGAAAVAGDGQAVVSFSAPTSTGGSPLTGFTVTSSPGNVSASGSTSPITVSGLTNGVTYSFTVSASNAVGMSAPSAATAAVTPAPQPVVPVAPSAPVNVVATGGVGQAVVGFAAPLSDGGSPVTGYTVTSSPDGFSASGSSTPITVSGLSNGTAYTFTVRATNAVGIGSPSAASNSVTPAPVVVVPSAPVGVSVVAGDGRAVVSFSGPVSDGGSPVSGFVVTSSPGGLSVSGSGSPITVGGLTNGTAYSFTVQAVNAVGAGASAVSGVVVPQAAGLVELLPDPGFETGVSGWKAFNVGTLTSVVSPVHGGTKALKVAAVASGANLVGLTQNSVISNSVTGRVYSAGCWVLASGAGLNVQVRLLQYTQDFGVNTKLNTVLVNSLPVNTWTLVKVTGTATLNGYRIIPQIYSSNQTTNTGTITYDDCSVSFH